MLPSFWVSRSALLVSSHSLLWMRHLVCLLFPVHQTSWLTEHRGRKSLCFQTPSWSCAPEDFQVQVKDILQPLAVSY